MTFDDGGFDDSGGGQPPPEWYDDWLSDDDDFDTIRQILEEYGIEGEGDIIIDLADVNPVHMRGERFANFGDAIAWLHDIGVLGFSHVWYDEERDEYGVEVGDTP